MVGVRGKHYITPVIRERFQQEEIYSISDERGNFVNPAVALGPLHKKRYVYLFGTINNEDKVVLRNLVEDKGNKDIRTTLASEEVSSDLGEYIRNKLSPELNNLAKENAYGML